MPSEETMRYTPIRGFVDPNLANFYASLGQQSLENYRKTQDEITESAKMQAQGEIDRARSMRDATKNIIPEAIDEYYKAQDRGQKKALSEEQLASSKQARAEQAAMHPVALKTAEATAKTAETQASSTKRMEEAETALVQAKDAYPGEQMAQYKQRKSLELEQLKNDAQRLEIKLAGSRDEREKKQLQASLEQARASIAATNASIAATQASTALTKTQGEIATTELAASRKSQKIKELAARLSAPRNPEEVATIIQTMEKEGATPGEIGLAVQESKNNKQQSQLVQQALNAGSPEVQRTIKAIDDAGIFTRTATSLAQNLKAFKNASTFGADASGPLESIVQTLRSQNKNAEADRLGKRIEILAGMDQSTRTQRASQIIGEYIDELASDLASRPGVNMSDPTMVQAMDSLSKARQSVAGMDSNVGNRNPFKGITNSYGMPSPAGATSPSPMLPAGVTPRGGQKVGKR